MLVALPLMALEYEVSWIANTYGGEDDLFVQMDARVMTVAPDGTVLLNLFWEEGGHNVGVYKDGKVLGNAGWTHGWGNKGGYGVAADEKYIYIAQRRDSEGGNLKRGNTWPPKNVFWFGVTRWKREDNGTSPVPFEGGFGSKGRMNKNFKVINVLDLSDKSLKGWKVKQQSTRDDIRGLAVHGGKLYVSNPPTGEILVLDTESMELVAAWKAEATRSLAISPSGALWVVSAAIDKHGRMMPDAAPAKILSYTLDGTKREQEIVFDGVPTGLAFTPKGKLLVSDNGPDQNIKIYDNVDTAPALSGSFGKKGGIYHGVRGKIEPLKFHGPQGVGCDAAGNIYVLQNGWGGNGSGLALESYTPAGERNWVLYGLEFVDCGGFDHERDGEHIYTTYEHFTMDYSKPAGKQWTYTGHTVDRFTYPEDPRINTGLDSVWVRTVDGKRLYFMTNMYSSYLAVFQDGEGEILKPCAFINPGSKHIGGEKNNGFNTGEAWPKAQPPREDPKKPVRWIWRDTNGDGQFAMDEYVGVGDKYPSIWAWWADSKGDVWFATRDNREVYHLPLQGWSEGGAPLYDFASAKVVPAPAPWDEKKKHPQIERVLYLPGEDVMFLGGFTPEYPNPDGRWWKNVGRAIVRYDNWSTAPEKQFTIALPAKDAQDGIAPDYISSMAVAGDYVFAIQGTKSIVLVYEKATRKLVGTMPVKGPGIGDKIGWIDIPYGMDVHKRANGEYLILIEDDFRSKNVLLRWTPKSAQSTVTEPVVEEK